MLHLVAVAADENSDYTGCGGTPCDARGWHMLCGGMKVRGDADMIWRLLAFVVAALLVQGVAHAQKGEAAFHCVVKSAYYVDRGDQPIPDTGWNWERTKIDVLIHNGKALVTHQLFGFSMPVTEEFSILQLRGANNS